MNFENITPRLKLEILERAVLYGTPEEVSEIFKLLGRMPFTARALGYACRFRGLDMVKTLVEGGALFAYDADEVNCLYRRDEFDTEFGDEFEYYSVMLLNSSNWFLIEGAACADRACRDNMPKLLLLDERRAILDYLCEDPQKTGFDMNELLYYAYFADEPEMVAALRSHGAFFSERRKMLLAKHTDSDAMTVFYQLVISASSDEFAPTLSAIIKEMGEYKLPITDYLLYYIEKTFPPPQSYKFLRQFDLRYVSLWEMITNIILCSDLDALDDIMENDLIQNYNECQRLIEFAVQKGETPCSAALMNYMNRVFDVAAKRKRDELKSKRDLDENGLPTEPVL